MKSDSKDLRGSEWMLQAAYHTTFLFKTSNIFWTLAAKLAYIFIPTPGKGPDLDAAYIFTARFVVLF